MDKFKEENCDLVLICGDIFDKAKPKFEVVNRTFDILRNKIYGNKNEDLQLLNEKEEKIFGKKMNVNEENININLPIIAIHGNHDEPVTFCQDFFFSKFFFQHFLVVD